MQLRMPSIAMHVLTVAMQDCRSGAKWAHMRRRVAAARRGVRRQLRWRCKLLHPLVLLCFQWWCVLNRVFCARELLRKLQLLLHLCIVFRQQVCSLLLLCALKGAAVLGEGIAHALQDTLLCGMCTTWASGFERDVDQFKRHALLCIML